MRTLASRSAFALLLALCAHCGPTAGGGGTSTGASCASICTHLATGMCTAPATQCESTCLSEGAAVPTACADLLSLYKSCRASAAVVCDGSGAATTPSCASQQTALEACVRNPPAPPPAQQPPSAATCAGVCARGDATCPMPSTDCAAECDAILATACASAMRAVLQCAASGTFRCGSSGRPSLAGCTAESAALVTCLNP